MDNLGIIPFGKYKGQPIEVLQADKQYTEWLSQQDWFKEKYATFQTLIINNFNTPQDSPEHNKLAELFLNDEFCWKVFKFCKSRVTKEYIDTHFTHNLPNSTSKIESVILYRKDLGYKVTRKFEIKEGSDVFIEITRQFSVEYNVKIHQYEAPKSTRNSGALFYDYNKYRILQLSNIDVPVFGNFYYESRALIEIKPAVGDDYPTIIRQCRAQKSNVLFIGQYRSSVLSIDSFRKMFPDIKIVLLSDIQ